MNTGTPSARTGHARLKEREDACRACGLWSRATQAVPGEGPIHAELFLVGEQPGDQEDRTGRPFVGPAGRLLDRALAEAGIDRRRVFVTNAVKHFNWQPGPGKQRIHKKPNAREVGACRRWLDEELALVRPRAILALGATAAQALLGRGFRVSRQRGIAVESPLAPVVMATVHPSSLLRIVDDAERHRETERFIEDLKRFRCAADAASARREKTPATGSEPPSTARPRAGVGARRRG